MEFENVRDVIVETLGCDAESVKPEVKLTGDLSADSLAAVELVMALEEATGIAIDDAGVVSSELMPEVNIPDVRMPEIPGGNG